MRCFALLTMLILLSGCDEKQSPDPVAPSKPAVVGAESETNPTGPIRVDALKIVASAHTLRMPDAPKPSDVEAALMDALYATESFSADGERHAQGRVTYDIRTVEIGGKDAMDVVVFGELEESRGTETLRYSAEVVVDSRSQSGMTPQDLVSKAVQKFSKRVDGHAQVTVASDEEIIKWVKDAKAEPGTRLFAVQEVRDRRLTAATEDLRPLLMSKDERLKIAVAATLTAFRDEESYSKIIGIAEELSRNRNPQLMPLLYMIGDMGTDESQTYLKAVADGHSDANAQRIAAEVLSRGVRP